MHDARFTGTYLRGFQAFIVGAYTENPDDIIEVKLAPSSEALQRYATDDDCRADDCFTDLWFNPPTDETQITHPKPSKYKPPPRGESNPDCLDLSGPYPVFSEVDQVCATTSSSLCPTSVSNPPKWCIEEGLAGGGAAYFGQDATSSVPGFGDVSSAYNFPSIFTGWTLEARSGSGMPLQLSEASEVLFNFYFLGLGSEIPPTCVLNFGTAKNFSSSRTANATRSS